MSSTSTTTKPSLAVLDDYFYVSKPLFSKLEPQLSKLDIFDTTISASQDPDALIARLKPYTIISTMRERTAFPRAVLSQLPNLKLLHTTGLRNASIDIAACQDLGIVVGGTTASKVAIKADGFDNTSEHCWALILTLAKGTARDDKVVKEVPSGWESRTNLSLAGKTLGMLGLGRLGANAARTGVLGFGMKVVAWSENLTQEKADAAAESKGIPKGTFEVVGSKDELFKRADVLSIQYVLSDRSRGMVGKQELEAMKPSAILVNTSRGPIVQEQALLVCLKHGKIRGAALDVFDQEPLPENSPWRSTEWGADGKSELVLSPHMGYVENQTMNAWYEETVENVERWLKGEELVNKMTR